MKQRSKLSIKFSLIAVFLLSNFSFAQQAKEGMVAQQHNFSSFSSPVFSDQGELARFSSSQGHPEYGVLPFNAPCDDCIELIEERTSDTRTFLRVGRDGKEIMSQKGYSPLHYQNNVGQWITYNPKLKKESGSLFRVNNQFYDIQINTATGAISFENKHESREVLTFHKNLAFESLDANGDVVQSVSANWANFSAGEEGAIVSDIFPGIDLTILVYRNIIKTNFIVKQDLGVFQIRETLDNNVFDNLDVSQPNVNTLDFYENGELSYQIGEIKIFGANEKRDFVIGNYTIENGDVVYKWNQTEFNGLSYPITIDPTVTSNGSLPQASILGAGDFSNVGAFTAGCIYNLAVPTPANCVITDVDWTFTYSAQNGGVLADGAVRFGLGTCVSPSGAGFFWFCNNTTAGGTCAGANVSIFADFSTCIPAPACLPYNLDFTMEFFDAWGFINTLNCDPTFVSAASDWTMTITGETVDQPAAPTSTSGGLICEGSSTDLSTVPAFGVGPYVISWDNGGGVGNPVTVSPTTTTTYTATITDACGQTADNTIDITVQPAPDAGIDGNVALCTTDPTTSLFGVLTGTPDATGAWTGPSVLTGGSSGDFDPATMSAGVYTYTVPGVAPCVPTSSTVTVSFNPLPNAGASNAVSFCPTDPSSDLFAALGGAPDAGGTWAPAMASGSGVYDPAVDPAGLYTYTVTNSCGSISSDITVTLNPLPNPGTAGTLSICATDPAADLFLQLGGTPDAGGSWSPAMASGTGFYNPAVDPAGTYTYTATNGCGNATADVTVTIATNPDPGLPGAISFCTSDAAADLFNSLTGTPTTGGTWSPAMASGSGVFDPAVDAAGVYTYSVNACGGGALTAAVTVTLNPAPNAGTDNTLTLCDNDPSQDLFGQILGGPDAGGTWSPAMTSGTGVFDPLTDAAGVYVYTVTNSCGSASSNIAVTVNSCAPPAAGFTLADTLVCFGDCFQLLDTSLYAPTTWDWDFGGAATPNTSSTQNPTICVDSIGTFVISLTAGNGNGSSTTTVNLTVAQVPTVAIIGDTTIDMSGTAFLTSYVDPPGGDYTWSSADDDVECPSCQSNYLDPLLTSQYTLTYTTLEGCTAVDSGLVTVLFMDLIDVPNGFSPNSDGNNDVLMVKGEGIASMNFVIHNRYGQEVFSSNSQSIGWDGSLNGSPQNPGVFVWYLEYTLIDGTSNFKKGNVTLIK